MAWHGCQRLTSFLSVKAPPLRARHKPETDPPRPCTCASAQHTSSTSCPHRGQAPLRRRLWRGSAYRHRVPLTLHAQGSRLRDAWPQWGPLEPGEIRRWRAGDRADSPPLTRRAKRLPISREMGAGIQIPPPPFNQINLPL